MCCDCVVAIGLRRGQAFRVAELIAERDQFLADGDEYHASEIGWEILSACSLARIIHACEHVHEVCPYTGLQLCC